VSIFEWELQRIDWTSLRTASGSAAKVPTALRALAAARTDEEARAPSWDLDTTLTVQGRVFQAAEQAVPFLLQLLCGGRPNVCWYVLDLLYQLTGAPACVDPSEVEHGNGRLVERCRERAREGLAVVYWLLDSAAPRVRISAFELLEYIEQDTDRLTWVLQRMSEADPNDEVREQASLVLAGSGRA
jgi:hypothetical protein